MGADKGIKPSHMSLFTALFVIWRDSGYRSRFSASRKALMAISSIDSIATYHKCVKELNRFGYIIYAPSYHPKEGSTISMPQQEGK
jgi:hypothetical protein